MIGVDPRRTPGSGPPWWDPAGARPQWFRADIRPHVDGLTLAAPAQAVVGTPVTLRATVTQGTRQVPVGYPVGYDWSASPSVHIGGWTGIRPWHVARLDPDTGELTALRPATVTVRIAVNGAEATATVALVAASPGVGQPSEPFAASRFIASSNARTLARISRWSSPSMTRTP
jgi:hypothetical protein